MKPPLIRPWLALSLLLWLVACSTAPTAPAMPGATAAPGTVPVPRPRSPKPPGPAATAAQPDFPALPAAPFDAHLDALVSEPARPALLAGEAAREFQRGGASWYGPGFHGRLTASGERFDMHALTAAHRTLPFGTLVRVHSLVNGREVDVRITDRGPFIGSRVIDLSRAAAQELDMLGLGFKEVVLMVPESTPPVARSPASSAVKKRARPARRTPAAPAR